MFTKQKCRQLQLKTINRFNVDTKKWKKSIYYPKKYQNFHGCELTIAKKLNDPSLNERNSELMEKVFATQLNAKLKDVNATFAGISDLNREDYYSSDYNS